MASPTFVDVPYEVAMAVLIALPTLCDVLAAAAVRRDCERLRGDVAVVHALITRIEPDYCTSQRCALRFALRTWAHGDAILAKIAHLACAKQRRTRLVNDNAVSAGSVHLLRLCPAVDPRALVTAVRVDDAACAEFLLGANASEAEAALAEAVEVGSVRVLPALLAHVRPSGALVLRALPHVAVLRVLLEAGAPVPADAALHARTPEALALLVAHGADAHVCDGRGRTALAAACVRHDETALATALLDVHGAHVDARDYEGETPLMLACAYDRPAHVALLLAHGADPNAETPSEHRERPLTYARHARDAVVERLLAHGAVPVDLDEYLGRPRMLARLLERGGDANAPIFDGGMTLLMAAVDGGHADAVALLLEHGADVHARNDCGRTAVTYVGADDLALLDTLVGTYGADVNARDDEDRTLFDIVGARDNPLLAAQLASYGAVSGTDARGLRHARRVARA